MSVTVCVCRVGDAFISARASEHTEAEREREKGRETEREGLRYFSVTNGGFALLRGRLSGFLSCVSLAFFFRCAGLMRLRAMLLLRKRAN